MILSQAVHSTMNMLSTAGIDDSLIEAEFLTCHALGISKTQLFTMPERTLTLEEINNLQHLAQRRLYHEPTAYILGFCEFYGINFYIDHRALIPRPETELLVEEAIEFSHRYPVSKYLTIADVGTGSGVIAISLALALSQAKIYATDISFPALQVAEINCLHHRVDSQVRLLQGNLLEPLPHPVDIIVANLPYIKTSELEMLSPEITNFEPITALSGGKYGLDKIRLLLSQLPGHIQPEGCLLVEIGRGQDNAVVSLINSYFPQAILELFPDLGGINRVVKVTFQKDSMACDTTKINGGYSDKN